MRVFSRLKSWIPTLVFAAAVTWPGPVLALERFLVETADESPDSVGGYNSLALDGEGSPHIAYYDGIAGNLKYARRSGNAWTVETADGSASDVGGSSSLALDDEGNPHVSYVDDTTDDLRYARRVGGAWVIETVVESLQVFATSLAVDAQGNPHITYTSFTGPPSYGEFKYARRSGNAWSIERVQGAILPCDDPYSTSSLVLDAEGNPQVIYSYLVNNKCDWAGWCPTTGGALLYARKSAGAWTIGVLSERGSISSRALALDPDGNPHVCYQVDLTPGGWGYYNFLRYARKTDVWNYELVAWNTFSLPSIAVDVSGNPHLAFGGLAYGKRIGGTWTMDDVDRASDLSYSLVLGGDGTPHFSYHHGTNGSLKYARARRVAIREEGEQAVSTHVTSSGQAPSVQILASPNPSSGGVSISWRDPSPSQGLLDLAVFDASGRKIRTLASQQSAEMMRSVVWDGKEDSGHEAAGGIYFIRIVTRSGAEASKRVTLVR